MSSNQVTLRLIECKAINANAQFCEGIYVGTKVVMYMTNGYINATKLVKQVKTDDGNPKRYCNWTETDQYKALSRNIAETDGIPIEKQSIMIKTGPNDLRGTYVHQDYIPIVAAWASVEFARKVICIVHKYAESMVVEEKNKALMQKDTVIMNLTNQINEQKQMIQNFMEYTKSTHHELINKVDGLHEDNQVLLEHKTDLMNKIDILVDAKHELIEKVDELHNAKQELIEAVNELHNDNQELIETVDMLHVDNQLLQEDVNEIKEKLGIAVKRRVPPDASNKAQILLVIKKSGLGEYIIRRSQKRSLSRCLTTAAERGYGEVVYDEVDPNPFETAIRLIKMMPANIGRKSRTDSLAFTSDDHDALLEYLEIRELDRAV